MKTNNPKPKDWPQQGQDATAVEIAAEKLQDAMDAFGAVLIAARLAAANYQAAALSQKCSDPGTCVVPACTIDGTHEKFSTVAVGILAEASKSISAYRELILSRGTHRFFAARIKSGKMSGEHFEFPPQVGGMDAFGAVLTPQQLKNLLGGQ